MKLQQNKAIGPENIPLKYIKMTSELIALALSNIYNQCVEEGKFPYKLKLAKKAYFQIRLG